MSRGLAVFMFQGSIVDVIERTGCRVRSAGSTYELVQSKYIFNWHLSKVETRSIETCSCHRQILTASLFLPAFSLHDEAFSVVDKLTIRVRT